MHPDQTSIEASNDLYSNKFKVVLLGNSGVGKTSVLERISRNVYDDRKQQTIGIDFLKKTVTHNKISYKMMLWDTAGQQRYNSLVPNYIRGTDCAIIMYDVGDEQSFQDCKKWLQMVQNILNSQKSSCCSILLVGNKSDIKQRKIKFHTGFEWALNKKLNYAQVSAKTGSGIENLVIEIIESTDRKIQSASTVDSQKLTEPEVNKIDTKKSDVNSKKTILSLKKNNSQCCSI